MLDLTLGFALAAFASGFVGYFGLLGSAGNLGAKGLFFYFVGLTIINVSMGLLSWIRARYGARIAATLEGIAHDVARVLHGQSRFLRH